MLECVNSNWTWNHKTETSRVSFFFFLILFRKVRYIGDHAEKPLTSRKKYDSALLLDKASYNKRNRDKKQDRKGPGDRGDPPRSILRTFPRAGDLLSSRSTYDHIFFFSNKIPGAIYIKSCQRWIHLCN